MIFRETALRGACIIELEPHTDDRGQFVRTCCREEFACHGIDVEFAQSSVSINPERGTMRGLHWQAAPHAEAKLVRCVRGAIYDVIVDIEPGSPTFGNWIAMTLTPQSQFMLYVPKGFAHGFQTLVDETEVNYLLSSPYVAAAGRGIRYDDPALAISWPLPVSRISDRDRSLPLLDKRSPPQVPAGPTPASAPTA
jgi:dTDP-4-dehydrorhamnose 3,5-epimerase